VKEYHPDSIRNICLVGHGGSGKTSLSELMLFTAGEINRIGKINEGNTTSDYSPNEIEKQFSIQLSLLHLEWQNTKINIIDTPGYNDFIGDVKCGLKVSDIGIIVLKAVEGVEVGTEISNSFISEYNLPNAILINKIDNEHSRFKEVVQQAKERLNSNVIVITFPVNEGLGFDTIVDIVKMKAYKYDKVGTRKIEEINIPESLNDIVESYRTELIEKVAEDDEQLMNKYLEEGSLSEDELKKGILNEIKNKNLTPVFALSAENGVGVDNFLNFVVEYFPSPLERGPVKGILKEKNQELNIPCDENGEPVLFVFKILSEPHVGELSLFRVYSGKILPGMDLINETIGKSERLSQLSILNGKNRKEIPSLIAGDIGAVVKLRDTHTNNTLSSKNFPVELGKIKFPEPIIRGAIIPKSKGDEDKIAACLHSLHEEDPSFTVEFDPEISQTIISGQGELHLALAVKRLKERYGVDVNLVEPKIPFKENIKGVCNSVEYKHKKQSGGRGQFGHVFLKIEPLPRSKGFEFVDAIVGGVVPNRFIPAVEKGVLETISKGVLAGYPIVDVKVTLFDGSYHPVDSDEISFKIAASQAFRKGFLEAKPILLEPIYEVEVTIPEEFMGDVMGDLSSRRGKILGMESDGHFQIIKAYVPLSELYKYSSTLRSLTSGRGTHKRKFAYYEEVPKEIEVKIIEESKKEKVEA